MTHKIDNIRLCKPPEAKQDSFCITALEHGHLVNRIKCLGIKLHGASKEVARLQSERSCFVVELQSRRALDADIIRKLQTARNTAEALHAALAREVADTLHIENLKYQNVSLQSEAAKVDALKNDLHLVRKTLHRADVDCLSSAIVEEYKENVIATQAASKGRTLDLITLDLITNNPGISTKQLTDKVNVSSQNILITPLFLPG